MKSIEELYLSESYTFEVVYKTDKTAFAGRLELSPNELKLTIRGDEYQDRKIELYEPFIGQLVCHGYHEIFILNDLVLQKSSSRVITEDYLLWFQEVIYTAGSVIHCHKVFDDDLPFGYVKLFSKSVGQWLGLTTTQARILESFDTQSPSIFEDSPYEFSHALGEYESIGAKYNISFEGGYETFTSGLSFSPTLDYHLNLVSAREVVTAFHKTFNFLAFVLGHDPVIDRVELYSPGCIKASLYVATGSAKPERRERYVMLPSGLNVKPEFNYANLPPIPSVFFSRYFGQDSELSSIVEKYIKYRSMTNIEEQFLGFFRLLEKQCFKPKDYLDAESLKEVVLNAKELLRSKGLNRNEIKSFEGALKKANGSKYNTEKCISDFYNSLPRVVGDSLDVGEGLIAKICKLRNDISHANHYVLSDTDLYTYTSMVEKLLTLSLLERLGLDLGEFEQIAKRLD